MPKDGLTVVEKTNWDELTILEKILRLSHRRQVRAGSSVPESALNSMEFFSRNSCPKCGYKPDIAKARKVWSILFFAIFMVFFIPYCAYSIRNSEVRGGEASRESDQALKTGPKTNSVVREKETSRESDQALKNGGGGNSDQFRWYHELIHDRFFNQWEQPTSIFEQDKSFVCTVKIRILKDGTISSADIVRGSGNPIMDTSVLAAVKRVSRIDPLPGGLGAGDGYAVNINFELQ